MRKKKYTKFYPDFSLVLGYVGIRYDKEHYKKRAKKQPIFIDNPDLEENRYNAISQICNDYKIEKQFPNICWLVFHFNPQGILLDFNKHEIAGKEELKKLREIIKLNKLYPSLKLENSPELVLSGSRQNLKLKSRDLINDIVGTYLDKHSENMAQYKNATRAKKNKLLFNAAKEHQAKIIMKFLTENTSGLTNNKMCQITGHLLHYMGLPCYNGSKERNIISEYHGIETVHDLIQQVKGLLKSTIK